MIGSGLLHRLRTQLALVLAVLAASLTVTVATAVPAHADEVWAPAGATLIKVTTGSKNYGNHTQYVTYVTVLVGSNPDHTCGKFEAWTQGYYQASKYLQRGHFFVSRWVSTGNYVGGAFTASSGKYSREVGCIAIRGSARAKG